MAAVLVAGAGLFVAGPAQAAPPDTHGFVLWNGGFTVPSGTWPPATTVTPTIPGRYRILFPGQAAPGGVVHVTPVNDAARWCQAVKWGASGADELVYVDCYQPGGIRVPTAFSAFFESRSSGTTGQFGYVFTDPSGFIVSEFNSAGAGNGVTPIGPGLWEVTLKGLATPGPVDGGIQVTAVSGGPARCKVAKWASSTSDQLVVVACFDASGLPLNTAFTLTYQYEVSLYGAVAPPKYFGYAWDVPPAGPPTTNFNSQVGLGLNAIVPAGPGLTLVVFPQLAVLPDNIQVTAFGSGPEYCGLLTSWTHSGTDTVVRDVSCYDSAGNRTTTGFLISANSQF
jgi:hypothetical protein